MMCLLTHIGISVIFASLIYVDKVTQHIVSWDDIVEGLECYIKVTQKRKHCMKRTCFYL